MVIKLRIKNELDKPIVISLRNSKYPLYEDEDEVVNPGCESTDYIGLEDGDNNCEGTDVLIVRDVDGVKDEICKL